MPHVYPGTQRLNVPQHVDIHHVLEYWAVRTPDAPVLLASGRIRSPMAVYTGILMTGCRGYVLWE